MSSQQFDNEFYQLLERFEQDVLRLARCADPTPVKVTCRLCENNFDSPFYLEHDTCPDCDPQITLEPDTFESLLQEKREEVFVELSELDERYRAQPAIQLRDQVLDELEKVRKWAEASAAAGEVLADSSDVAEFGDKEYKTMVDNLLRIRSLERLGMLFGLQEDILRQIIEKRIDVLFGRKPPRKVPIALASTQEDA
jgi:hypothetical protein